MKKQKKMAMETTPNAAPTTTSSSSKKKKGTKREVETRQTLAAVVEAEEKASHGSERVLEGSFAVAETAVVVEGEEDWREWWRPEVLVDEQMSWGSVWFSFWEQENGNCDNAFYSDVMEEDDIWDLRSIKQVPQ